VRGFLIHRAVVEKSNFKGIIWIMTGKAFRSRPSRKPPVR